MDEFIKKLIERLEAEKEENPCRKTLCKECKYTNNCYEGEQSGKVAIDNAISIANELAEEYNNGWIACSERFSEVFDNVLICTKSGGRAIGHRCPNQADGRFYDLHSSAIDEVIAWRPLPEPYKQGKQV